MLWQIEVVSNQGALLSLPLEDASSGLIVEEVEGLDPVKATLVSSGVAQGDGEIYQSSRREMRNLKLKIGLEPDYAVDTVRELRKRLYGFFMPKSEVMVRFYHLDEPTVWISGRVESFETMLFAQEPVADISIVCFDPDFYDPNPMVVGGSTVTTGALTRLTYDGTIETGLIFTLNVNRALSEFTIYQTPPDGSLRQLDFAANLDAGDVLTISTVAGSKYARVNKAGSESSVLYGISPQSQWLELMPGDNDFRVYAEGAAVPFTITYTNKYGGL